MVCRRRNPYSKASAPPAWQLTRSTYRYTATIAAITKLPRHARFATPGVVGGGLFHDPNERSAGCSRCSWTCPLLVDVALESTGSSAQVLAAAHDSGCDGAPS